MPPQCPSLHTTPNAQATLSLREIAAELSMSYESIRTILNGYLGMKRVAARLVPKNLNFLQKLNCAKAKNSTNTYSYEFVFIEQPPYSPDMVPADFFFLSKTQITTSRHPFFFFLTGCILFCISHCQFPYFFKSIFQVLEYKR